MHHFEHKEEAGIKFLKFLTNSGCFISDSGEASIQLYSDKLPYINRIEQQT